MAVALVWNGLVILPIYALSFACVLDRWTLGVSSFALSSAVIAACSRGFGWNRLVSETATGVRSLLSVPRDAVLLSWRSRSLLILGVVATAAILSWQAICAWYAPTWGDWDALWYHEPIVAFTIQNHGFRKINLQDTFQYINGFERLCEMTQLWFAIYAGRRLVDIANIVMCPLLIASMAALALRYTRDKALALGWGLALALLPANMRLLRTTMVDPHSSALILAASYFATHPGLRPRNVFLAILGLTLAIGSKTIALYPVFLLSLMLLFRLLRARRSLGTGRTWALIGAGTLGVVGMWCTTHLTNYLRFGNPLWPVMGYTNEALGIHWKGWTTIERGTSEISSRSELPALLDNMFMRPYGPTNGVYNWQINDLGFAGTWVLIPLGGLAFAIAIVVAVRGFLRNYEEQSSIRFTGVLNLTALAIVTAFTWRFTPALEVARYHVPIMGWFMAAIAWMCGKTWQRMSYSVVFVIQLGAILMTYWSTKPWILPPSAIANAMDLPYAAREASASLGAPVEQATGMAREREVTAGSVVMYDSSLSFLALAWNNDYSNKVIWADDPTDPLGQAERLGAVWVYTAPGSRLAQQLAGAQGRWEEVGMLESERRGSVYRHR